MIYRLLLAALVFQMFCSGAYADVESAKAALLKEKSVIKYLYNPDNSVQWEIGMKPDGSVRYGFAGYVCQVLRNNDALTPTTWVRVFNVDMFLQGSSPRDASMGRVGCKDLSRLHP